MPLSRLWSLQRLTLPRCRKAKGISLPLPGRVYLWRPLHRIPLKRLRQSLNVPDSPLPQGEKQCTFQKFCKSVLHNEACNAHEEIRRRRVREVTFSDLALYEERQLYTVDKYFQDEEAEPSYQMAGKEITPKLLLEAIRALPEERRKIVLLYYFEGLTDIEIAKQLNISRSTVQYRRTSSFEQLKKYLEENADEWIEW